MGNRPIILMFSTLWQISNMKLIKLPEKEMSKDDLQQITNWNEHLRPLWASSISASSSVVQCSSRRRTVHAAPVAAFSLSKKSKWLKRWQKPVRLKREKEAIERLARSKPRTELVVVWVEWAKQSKLKRDGKRWRKSR